MKYLFPLLIAVLIPVAAVAQTFTDALRYSYVFPQGTARFAGTGGSLTPLGVDYTTLHTNPAGIGWNRNSSLHLTPGLTLTGVDAQLVNGGGNPVRTSSVNAFTLPSAGAIFAGSTRSVNWSTLNFGIGVSRLADFNQTIDFNGRSERSIVDAFVEDLNDNINDPFRANLILEIPNSLFEDADGFFSDFDLQENQGGQIEREGLIQRTGSINEVVIGFGGNYREKLLWGASFGIPFMSFEETYSYEEVDDLDEISGFDNAGFDQNLTASGTGFNVKFGLIYRPTAATRVSAAVHSPTFWTIDEEYFTTLEYNFTDQNEAQGGTALSPISVVTNNLMTPWRFSAGLGVLVGTSGFLSVDADYANYAANAFSFDDFATQADAVNADIDAILGSSLGVRLGGELNLSPVQLRAGVGYRQLPFREYLNDEDTAQLTYSAGAGYSFGKVFIDFAAQYSAYTTFHDAYQVVFADPQTVNTDRSRISALITVGVRGFQLGF